MDMIDELQAIQDRWLPEWAIRHAAVGKWEVGAQLCTKDGRNTGNAHIVDITPAIWKHGTDAYQIITDAGNRMVMTLQELETWYYPPRYISDASTLLARFEKIT